MEKGFVPLKISRKEGPLQRNFHVMIHNMRFTNAGICEFFGRCLDLVVRVLSVQETITIITYTKKLVGN